MKRPNSHTAAHRLEKRLVLNRETLRRLGAEELAQVPGASGWISCGGITCTSTKFQEDEPQ